MDGAWRGEAKRGGAGAAGCEDGEEGGEAARSGTITEQAASVVALHCVAAGYVGSGDGRELRKMLRQNSGRTFTEEAAPNQSGSSL